MKKVLIICEKLAEERTGGIQTRVINYTKNLPKFYISPNILSIAKYEDINEENYYQGIIYRYPKNNLTQILKFAYSHKNNFDIFHFLEGINNIQHFILFLFLLRKRPIVSLYGGEMYDVIESGNLFAKLKIIIVQKLANKIIVNSQSTRDFVPNNYHHKVYIVNPGVNSEYLQYLDKYHKDDQSFTLFFAGRLIRRKGLDDIIKSINVLKNNIKNIKLNVAGSGPNLTKFKNLTKKLDLTDKVKFLGDVKNIDIMAKLYTDCDIFLMTPKLVSNPPGGYESFGCVYLEANLFKKPVIGTKHFGVQEAIIDGKTGILVNEGNATEIAQAVKTLYNEPSLAKNLGLNGYKRVKENFMDINSTKQLKDAYL